jgi:hypothetical protein
VQKEAEAKEQMVRKLQEALADSAERLPRLQETNAKLRAKHEADKEKIRGLEGEVGRLLRQIGGGGEVAAAAAPAATAGTPATAGSAPPASRVVRK